MSIRSARLLGGRYQLHAVVGRGGMAAVWAGLDTRLDRTVAVKILEGAALADPAMVRRLDDEARTLARLAHPNIVAGYDVGTEDGVPYLVMEFVEGDTLAQRLAGGALDVGTAVGFAVQICRAMEAAHQAGVVHRDIKPENVLLTPAGSVKVCDFGVARFLHASRAGLTGPSAVIGTCEYMAPEQAAAGEIDERSDLYAFGCVLYHMLAGRPPLTGDRPMRVLWRHVHEVPARLSAVRPDVPAELDVLVAQLLAKDPAQRPPTARAVADHLSAVPIEARATPRPAARHGTGEPIVRASAARSTVVTRAAGTGTRTMPALPYEPAPRRERFRAGPVGIAAVAVCAAVVAALAVALAMGPDRSTPPAADAGTSTTTSAPTSGPPAGSLDAVRAAILAAAASGQLDPHDLGDLDQRLDQIARSLDGDNPGRMAQRIRDLRSELDDLRHDDKLSDTAYATITASLDALVATLPTNGNGGGDNRGPGNGGHG